MSALPEGDAGHSILVAGEAVHVLPRSQVPDMDAPVPPAPHQVLPIRADCQGQERFWADLAGGLADPLGSAVIPKLARRFHRRPLRPAL